MACTDESRYRVRLWPDGDQLARVVENLGGAPAGAAARPEGAARGAAPADAPRFRGDLPGDLGGGGTYLTWTSEMGTAHAYVEHLGSADDPWEEVQRIGRSSDRAADLLLGWLRSALAPDDFAALQPLVDQDLRRALKDLGLEIRLAYPADVRPSESAGWLLLAGSQLLEGSNRDATGLVAARMRAWWGGVCWGDESDEALASAVGAISPYLPPALQRLLADPGKALASFQSWYRRTPAGAALSVREAIQRGRWCRPVSSRLGVSATHPRGDPEEARATPGRSRAVPALVEGSFKGSEPPPTSRPGARAVRGWQASR